MRFNITDYNIRNFAKNGVVYVMGYDIYKDGGVKHRSVNFYSQYDRYEADAVVCNLEKSEKQSANQLEEVRVIFDTEGNICGSFCSCGNSKCEHSAALLFDIMNGNDKIESKRVNIVADNMFKIFEKMEDEYFENEILKSKEPVELMAELEFCNGNGLKCRFNIGREKFYKIKNVDTFVKQYKLGETVKYGKSLTVDNEIDIYSENALKIINFLCTSDCTGDYVRLFRHDGIGITCDNVDFFFETFREMPVMMNVMMGNYTSEKVRIIFYDNLKPVKIKNRTSEDGYEFYTDCQIDFSIRSKHYGYVLSGNSFYRVDKKYYECIRNFNDILKRNRVKKLEIQEEELTKFAVSVLPSLIRVGAAENYEQIQAKAGCFPLKTMLYIDCEYDIVTLTGKFFYGDNCADIFEESRNSNFPRNRIQERHIKSVIEALGFFRNDKKYIMSDDDTVYELYTSGIQQLNQIAQVYVTDAFKGKEIHSGGGICVGFRIKGELLEMDFDNTLFDYSEIEEVLKSYKIKKKYHRFKDGRIISFSDYAFDRQFKLLENLEISKADNGHFKFNRYRALSINKFLKENNIFNVEYNDEFERLAEDFVNFKNLNIEIPQEVRGVLRDYQKSGFKWLKTLEKYGFGGILADDMGLGKTIQAISLILSYSEKEKPSIIICPTSLIYNWQNEIEKFAPSLDVKVIAGGVGTRKKLIDEITPSVYITTYDMLKRDIDGYEKYVFKYIIADEAQAIKNPKTQNAKVIRQLQGTMRIALTGTPIENSLTELWSVFDFLMPGYLYNISKFEKNFSIPIMKQNDTEKQHLLKNMVMPFVLRRIKQDVLTELPEKIETTLYAEMSREQRKIYTAYFLKSKKDVNSILNKANGGRIEVLTILTRLRQICCHPSLFIDNYSDESGKLEMTMETIEGLISSGHRILVFSQFTSMLDLIAERLENTHTQYFYLSGETKAERRIDMAERFNSGENNVFLISLKAGGTGLNLTGADVVIHYDPWWNPAVMNQASDRVHRIGQKRSVQVFNMIAKDTIEEKILALQEKKKNLTDSIITDGEGFFGQLTKEEILSLFEDSTV